MKPGIFILSIGFVVLSILYRDETRALREDSERDSEDFQFSTEMRQGGQEDALGEEEVFQFSTEMRPGFLDALPLSYYALSILYRDETGVVAARKRGLSATFNSLPR